MSKIIRIARAPKFPKRKETGIYTIFYLEIADEDAAKTPLLYEVLHDSEVENIVGDLPQGDFHQVMYKNAIVDPQTRTIGAGCEKLGVKLEALKVARRYYGGAFKGVYVNPNVEVCFTEEPELTTLKPFGERVSMETYNLLAMTDDEIMRLSQDLNLSLSFKQMQKIRVEQVKQKLPFVTDLMLDVYAILWCDHCRHTWWQELGQLLKKLRKTTEEINNPNVISAFIDNAAVWDFYDDLVLAFGGETHNSPSRKWAFGGQITKTLGHDRDIFMTGLGAKPIMHLEMTTVGEFAPRKVYPILEKYVFSEAQLARETIAAVAMAGNTMGIPMGLARMYSHPAFGVKPFAFGGTVGITTKEAALKGLPRAGDLAVIINKTGNDGYHGGTVASKTLTGSVNTDDHVQIGDPFSQQKMMPAIIKIRDSKCVRANNDFGAGGFISAFGEMAEPKKLPWGSYEGGLLLNFALPPLKCAGLPYKIIAIGESQERFAFVVIPEKLLEFMEICEKFELEWTVVGVFTGNKRLQIIYDEDVSEFTNDTPLSGEVLLDLPYEAFEDCPLSEVKVVEPPPQKFEAEFPAITLDNIEDMAEKVAGHFDNCNQTRARLQYDSTVQGICVQGPIYGVNYNVGSHLAVEKPIYGKSRGLTVSMSFNPWLLEADPIKGAFSGFLDAYITHVAAGVNPVDIGLVDNFYSPSRDPYAPYYVIGQVNILCESQKRTGPIVNGKDSNHGSGEYESHVIHIPPSVNIMAVGKIPDVSKLILHQWRRPGNLLYSLGRRSTSLAGSILASALEIKGGKVETIPMNDVPAHVQNCYNLASARIYVSTVPVNRGGLIMRLFEGAVASGFGIETNLCAELFPESFGTILVEIEPENVPRIKDTFGEDALFVGTIIKEKVIIARGQHLNWNRLFTSWNTRFEREVYDA
ncbi:MAG: AIR synthase-related protein [bacterium]|nr:AIR synthase-related protein [bacterium]